MDEGNSAPPPPTTMDAIWPDGMAGDSFPAFPFPSDILFARSMGVKASLENAAGVAAAEGGVGAGGSGTDKKGMQAKHTMVERRRRKKLNDGSVVPKITKMDKISILGDATEYLKELIRTINDLQNEIESGSNSLVGPTFPGHANEEICPTSFPSPDGENAKMTEGDAVNIRMFCARKPGILPSIVWALDRLGLDVQQGVISSFDKFVMDIFRAERRSMDGSGLVPKDIKSALMQSAGLQ